ncbi:MAG TPA: hypothetical protein VKQ11_22100 [Candidatus Sulfotelmatobacter sp.]|nr:hypothetical protein [Candidatus Sulfotelmatobacter sp.]
MRKKTPRPTICVYCKLPIEKWQRPAIQMANGDQLHVECYVKVGKGENKEPKFKN